MRARPSTLSPSPSDVHDNFLPYVYLLMSAERPTIVLLHRNLRWEDNKTLWRAAELGRPVVVVFAFTRTQISRQRNAYFAPASFAFMIETLRELQREHPELLLIQFPGDPQKATAWRKLLQPVQPGTVLTAWDATPFARRRAAAIARAARDLDVPFEEVHEDLFMTDFSRVLTGSGTPYRLYTPFRNAVRRGAPVPAPRGAPLGLTFAPPPESWRTYIEPKLLEALMPCPSPVVRGGRKEALALLGALRSLRDYETSRNDPNRSTSHLGAHLKFGTVSVREVWHRCAALFGPDHALLDQLIWRDFFSYLVYHVPTTLEEGRVLQPQYDHVRWRRNDVALDLQRWAEGRTGVPLVDAGMRQLRTTGWMHGRVRMVVAQFLTKDLWIDWREGERIFAQHLIDYDPSVNLGNWMWSAGVGADPPKYGAPRIFNPFLQAQRFDPKADYIRRWVPELRAVPVRDILYWDSAHVKHPTLDYPPPMVDHSVATAAALERFRGATQ